MYYSSILDRYYINTLMIMIIIANNKSLALGYMHSLLHSLVLDWVMSVSGLVLAYAWAFLSVTFILAAIVAAK